MKTSFSLTSVLAVAVLCIILGAFIGSAFCARKIVDAASPFGLFHSNIANALESYHSDHGSYPSAEQGLSVLLGGNGRRYFQGEMKDPWGHPVRYFIVDGEPVLGFSAQRNSALNK